MPSVFFFKKQSPNRSVESSPIFTGKAVGVFWCSGKTKESTGWSDDDQRVFWAQNWPEKTHCWLGRLRRLKTQAIFKSLSPQGPCCSGVTTKQVGLVGTLGWERERTLKLENALREEHTGVSEDGWKFQLSKWEISEEIAQHEPHYPPWN